MKRGGIILSLVFVEDIFKDILADVTTQKINKFFDIKGNDLQGQFLYCIDKSLSDLSEKYFFEYNINIKRELYEKIMINGYVLSNVFLKELFSEIVDFNVDDDFIKEWLNKIEIIIAEEKLDILKNYIILKKLNNDYNRIVYPMFLTAKPPLPPEEYIDRDEEKIILEKIENSKKLVLVNGIGGIGKSTVCRKIFHRFNNRPLAWVV